MAEHDNNPLFEKAAQNDDSINNASVSGSYSEQPSDNLAEQEPLLLLENLEEIHNDEVQSEENMLADSESEADAAKKAKKKLLKQQRKAKGKEKKPAAAPAEEPVLQLGTAKGVETMFRNAFRTEMELLALAATKANIMISLNGFIVSALMISGAFIFSSAPEFLVPAGIFMV